MSRSIEAVASDYLRSALRASIEMLRRDGWQDDEMLDAMTAAMDAIKARIKADLAAAIEDAAAAQALVDPVAVVSAACAETGLRIADMIREGAR